MSRVSQEVERDQVRASKLFSWIFFVDNSLEEFDPTFPAGGAHVDPTQEGSICGLDHIPDPQEVLRSVLGSHNGIERGGEDGSFPNHHE
jgi:hypothetical protein